jgi:CheY-like chemotaxis protein
VEAAQALAPANDGDRAAAPRALPEPQRILLVEDNPDAMQTLAMLLELWGHRVTCASDGLAGVEQATAAPHDVALIDVGLPGIDGFEVARRIRSKLDRSAPLLVALTGYGAHELKARAIDAGFDVHLVKPVDADHLAEVLSRARGTDSRA